MQTINRCCSPWICMNQCREESSVFKYEDF
nr:MAG TPA: entity inhibitor [Caudoviricetes sp.]